MISNRDYKITMLEYALQSVISNGITYSGYFDEAPNQSVTYTLTLIENDETTILIETGYDINVEENKILADGCDIDRYLSPVEALKRIDKDADAIENIILTHCHWDHIGGLGLFKEGMFGENDPKNAS